MLSRRTALFALAGAVPASATAQQVPMTQLKALSAGSTLYGLRPAAEAFTRSTGIAVTPSTDHGHNIHKAIMSGSADADVVLLPSNWVDEAVAAGHARADDVIGIGSVRIGAAVRDGAPKPDVSTMDALRRSIVAADSVLLTLAPTGDHLMKVIERLGLAANVAPKLKRFDTATLLNRHLVEAASPGTLGFGPATEILVWRGKGVTYAGPVPDEIQIVLPYKAAVLERTRVASEARRLLAFLATPEARKHFHDSGVE